MKYRVVKEYNDTPDEPIKIVTGETLQFVEESNPNGVWANWVFCKGIGKEGWVPKQILNIEGNHITSLQDYHAKEHNLTLNEILIANYAINGWVWGVKESSPDVFAWAPLNHLKEE